MLTLLVALLLAGILSVMFIGFFSLIGLWGHLGIWALVGGWFVGVISLQLAISLVEG